MFTGIIQGLGAVEATRRINQERRLRIRPLFVMADIEDGESVAVNGVCLSVEEHDTGSFSAYASAETVSRSTLGNLLPGTKVNLEQALRLGQRLGGHIVSGHIDCVATVSSLAKIGQSLQIRLSFPREFSPQVISKGSVALDGISLTVNDCGPGYLEVNIIPDSQKRTNIESWRTGSKINMETDIIGKYVQNLLNPWERGRLNRDFLAANGFDGAL